LRSSPHLVGSLLPSAAEGGGAWAGAAFFPPGESLPAITSARLGAEGFSFPMPSDLAPGGGGGGPAAFSGAIPAHVSALRPPAPVGFPRRNRPREDRDKMAASAGSPGPSLELDSAA